MFDYYKKLKPKEKNEVNYRDYVEEGLNMLSTMFEYKRGPKCDKISHIEDRTIELILITSGNIIWTEKDGKLQCGFGYDGGRLDVNGVGTVLTGNMLNGEGLKATNNIDGILGYNNSTRTPDTMVYKFGELLTDLDISLTNAIIYTRENPIFLAENGAIAEQIKTFFKRLKQGEPLTIARKNTSRVGNTSSEIEQVQITNSDNVNKIQYLEQLHNSILRRAYTLYGQALSEGTKQAQQSIAETSSNISSSFIVPLDRLKQRQIMCDKLNDMFDLDLSVEFAEPWQVELDKFEQGDQTDVGGDDDVQTD